MGAPLPFGVLFHARQYLNLRVDVQSRCPSVLLSGFGLREAFTESIRLHEITKLSLEFRYVYLNVMGVRHWFGLDAFHVRKTQRYL